MVPSVIAVCGPIQCSSSRLIVIFESKPLTILGNLVFSLATRLHLIPSSTSDVEIGGYAQVPGTARAEAERRRWNLGPSDNEFQPLTS